MAVDRKLNLPHVSCCEMLHFVTSCIQQNKSRKQTVESAQNGLEIIFKLENFLRCLFFTFIYKPGA